MNAKIMFDPSIPLATATVQDIHLEFIRRSEHNAFHGERVLADLLVSLRSSLFTALQPRGTRDPVQRHPPRQLRDPIAHR